MGRHDPIHWDRKKRQRNGKFTVSFGAGTCTSVVGYKSRRFLGLYSSSPPVPQPFCLELSVTLLAPLVLRTLNLAWLNSTGFPDSPPYWWRVVGLVGPHNHVNQFSWYIPLIYLYLCIYILSVIFSREPTQPHSGHYLVYCDVRLAIKKKIIPHY